MSHSGRKSAAGAARQRRGARLSPPDFEALDVWAGGDAAMTLIIRECCQRVKQLATEG